MVASGSDRTQRFNEATERHARLSWRLPECCWHGASRARVPGPGGGWFISVSFLQSGADGQSGGAMDWSGRPSVHRPWTQSLRTRISLCLASNVPIHAGPTYQDLQHGMPICGTSTRTRWPGLQGVLLSAWPRGRRSSSDSRSAASSRTAEFPTTAATWGDLLHLFFSPSRDETDRSRRSVHLSTELTRRAWHAALKCLQSRRPHRPNVAEAVG